MLAEASLELKAVEIEIAHEKLNAKVSRERGEQHVAALRARLGGHVSQPEGRRAAVSAAVGATDPADGVSWRCAAAAR